MSGAGKPPDSLLTTPVPTIHYEGFVEKKGPKDKDYERHWLMLIGDKMVMYSQRIAQRELLTTKPVESVVVDKTWDIKPDNKERTKLTIKCKAGQYKFKMSTQDDRDNWWIRFYALAKTEHPKIHLLPGQTIALQEIINSTRYAMPETQLPSPTAKSPTMKTFVKQKSGDKPNEKDLENKKHRFYPEHLIQGFEQEFPIPPTWYLTVNRTQAEELLLNNPEHGAILIRKSESPGGEYSLSMRQEAPTNNPHAQPIVKHFHFSWFANYGSFKMAIEEEQPEMKTMYDMLAFFIEKHGGNIRPMQTRDPNVLKIPQHPYELGLRVSLKDPENGEARQVQDTYLQPQRVAPEPPSKSRPDRQSLPATFNMVVADMPGAEATSPLNRQIKTVAETSSPSKPSHYVVPNHERPMYTNVARDILPTVNEANDQNWDRRQQRFSTSVVPSSSPDLPTSNSRAPRLPPPRQRCISTSDASLLPVPESYASSITDLYSTPSGQTFALQRQQAGPLLPLATSEVSSKQAGTRSRAKIIPATSDDCNFYLTPINKQFMVGQELGNEPLPVAPKPTSNTALSNQRSVFKQPIREPCGSHLAPPTSYIHPKARPRGRSHPLATEGRSAAPEQAELSEIFKKFGIKDDN